MHGEDVEKARERIEKIREKNEYLYAVKSNRYWKYKEFISKYPNSTYLNAIQAKMEQFGIYKAGEDIFIPAYSLSKTYHWNGILDTDTTFGIIDGLIVIAPGRFIMGNLEFEGSVKFNLLFNDGLHLSKGTIMIYPK